ncbi:MAG: hypothetical protein HY645_00700 [Acidobacteria bacterium]|nr:hypothetical protein [Acidobacteriota bacterium]
MKRWIASLVLLVALGMGLAWSQKWQQVAVLSTDVSADESDLTVRIQAPIAVDRLILLESRDGSLKETYEVKHVLGDHLLIKQKLKHSFLAGSRVYQ